MALPREWQFPILLTSGASTSVRLVAVLQLLYHQQTMRVLSDVLLNAACCLQVLQQVQSSALRLTLSRLIAEHSAQIACADMVLKVPLQVFDLRK
jgi:hypothetical protein